MKLNRETELRLAAAIRQGLAAYLRNGAMQDVEYGMVGSATQKNQSRNYLEEFALQVEEGYLPEIRFQTATLESNGG